MKAFSLLGVCLLSAVPSYAQDLPVAYQAKPIYDRCEKLIDMRGLVNSQRIECATFDMDRADGALNAAYRVLVTHLPPGRRQQLVQSERAWMARRHAKCIAEQKREPQVQPDLAQLWCLAKETDARTAYLVAIK